MVCCGLASYPGSLIIGGGGGGGGGIIREPGYEASCGLATAKHLH